MSGVAEEIVNRVNDWQNGSISFLDFSREIEEFGRSRNIPLRDILNWKEDLYIMARRHESQLGTQAAENWLFIHFEMFKAKFAEPLPKGVRPQTGDDSDSQ